MSNKLDLETVFREYLDHTKKEDGEIIVLTLNYLSHLYQDEESGNENENILLEDFTHYEVDDFINFYLEDNFDNFEELQNLATRFLKNFLKFLKEKKYFNKEEIEEWTEILK